MARKTPEPKKKDAEKGKAALAGKRGRKNAQPSVAVADPATAASKNPTETGRNAPKKQTRASREKTIIKRPRKQPEIPSSVRRSKFWQELEELLAWQEQQHGSNGEVIAATLLTMGEYLEKQACGLEYARTLRDRASDIRNKWELERFPFSFYRDIGREALAEKRYERAESIFNTLRTSIAALDPNSVQMAQTLEFLAHAYGLQEKYNDALPLQSQALTKYQNALGEEHLHTIRCLGRFADLLWLNKQLDEAIVVAEWARQLFQKVLGKDDQETLRARTRLKHLKIEANTVQIARRTDLVRRHVEELTTRIQTAKAARDAQRVKEAAEAKGDDRVAPVPSEAATANSEFAHLLSAVPEAEPVVETNAAGETEQFDPQIFQFMWQKYMTAGERAAEGKDYLEAERMFKVATEKAHRFGPNDQRLWQSMCQLASVYASMGKFYKASILYQEAISLCEKFCGKEHPDIVPFLYNLAKYYAIQGELIKEKILLQRMIKICADNSLPSYVAAAYEERLLELKHSLID